MIFPIRLVYVCGAISAPTPEKRDANVEAGKAAGRRLWDLGAMPVVPHLNSLGMHEGGVTAEAIYLGDLALLARCDALLALPGWEASFGCNLEVAWARHRGIAVFTDPPAASLGFGTDLVWAKLERWLRSGATHFTERRELVHPNGVSAPVPDYVPERNR